MCETPSQYVLTEPFLNEMKKEAVREKIEGKCILDLGCGPRPYFAIRYEKENFCIALDVSPRLRKKYFKKHDIEPIIADARYLPFRDKIFDIIYASRVLSKIVEGNPYKELKKTGKEVRILERTTVSNEIKIENHMSENGFKKISEKTRLLDERLLSVNEEPFGVFLVHWIFES